MTQADPQAEGAGDTSRETVPCPFCEAEIGIKAKKCRHCREWVKRRCTSCNTPIKGEWAARGLCHECQTRANLPVLDQVGRAVASSEKSRTIAVILALVLGGLGFHKFYMGKTGKGILYLLFCWTGIPSLIGIFEGVHYAMMSDQEFDRRYLS